MRITKRLMAVLVALSMLAALLPAMSAAAAEANEYVIANDYITYSFNAATGGFCIENVDGHPQKPLDNNIPLLYKEDSARSNGTSFVTVRVNDTDYIFGQDYGWFGLNTTLEQPVISEQGRLITTKWNLKKGDVDISVIQKVAISLDENNDRAGNVAIDYALVNNGSTPVDMGLRLLLDAALDTNDAPYVLTETFAPDTYTETAYTGSGVPSQFRFMDSLSSSQKMAYTILAEDDTRPDQVIIGHWANLANTRYDYEPDPYFDYTSEANSLRVPDTAAAYYWEPKPVAAAASRDTQLLYGIGNFSSSLNDEKFAVGITQVTDVTLADNKKDYKNNGEFDVDINFDNLSEGTYIPTTYTVSLEEGLTFADDDKTEKIGALVLDDSGTAKMTFRIKAAVQPQITSKRVVVSVSGYASGAGGTVSSEYGADKSILLPAADGLIPDVQLGKLTPERVYFEGSKSITLSGNMKAFASLKGSDDWDLYLIPQGKSTDPAQTDWVRIEKKHIAFIDDTYTTMTFSTDEELAIGKYDVMFQFRGDMATHFGTGKISAGTSLTVTADPKDRLKIYGIAAMVRYSTDPTAETNKPSHEKYDIFTFNNEGEYEKFAGGLAPATSINGTTITFEPKNSYFEVLAVVRGQFRQMEDKSGAPYLQADPSESDITINNMLVYCGEEPLVMQKKGDEAAIRANGLIKVINSITVWRYEWSIKAKDGAVYYLQDTTELEGTSDPIENEAKATTTAKQLQVSLEGAGSAIQTIGGLGIKLQYGVLTCYHTNPGKPNDKVLYGLNFGGRVSLPLKVPTPKAGDGGTTGGGGTAGGGDAGGGGNSQTGAVSDGDASENGNLTAEIRNVLYGQKNEGDVGFKGINATFLASLPQDVLGSFIANAPGIEAEVVINTIENYYKINVGIEMVVLECEATIGLKQVPIHGSEKLMLDEIQFGLGGEVLEVPLVPPFVSMNYLGGGISDLADTVSAATGDFEGLPPLTIHAKIGLLMVEVYEGKLEAAISLYGLNLAGELSIRGTPWLGKIVGNIDVKWLDDFSITAYGRADFLEGVITGGINIIIRDDYFYGYIYAALKIPNFIPLVGGVELGRVEAAVSSDFIGANVKIIGIRFGVIYYWDGEFIVGKGIDLSSRGCVSGISQSELTDPQGKNETYYLAYGTNTHRLTAADSVAARAGKGLTKNFDPTQEEALLLEVPLYGDGVLTSDQIILTNPNGETITMYPDDGDGGGNYLIQDRSIVDESGEETGETERFLYITITSKSQLIAGDWTLTIDSDTVSADDFNVDAVETLPEIESMSYENAGKNIDVTWNADAAANAPGKAEVYLTKAPDAAEKLRNHGASANDFTVDKNMLISVGEQEFLSNEKTGNQVKVTIPDNVESGTYYVVTMINLSAGGMSVAMSGEPFAYHNTNEPVGVDSVALSYGGNGRVKADIIDPQGADYTDYIITLKNAGGETIYESLFGKDDEILLGAYIDSTATAEGNESESAQVKGLEPGETYTAEVKTVKKTDEGGIYYGQDVIRSDGFTLPPQQLPEVTAMESSIPDSENAIMGTGAVTARFTFDQPVRFASAIDNSNPAYGEEYATEWSINETALDGEHILSWSAVNENGDTRRGEIGFTVDTQPPVLTISKSEAKDSMAADEQTAPSGQTVFAGEDGSFTIHGITEPKASLTIDGSADGVTVAPDGTFTISGQLAAEQMNQQVSVVTLRAVDKAGHKTVLNVNVLNASLTSMDGISVLFDTMAATGDGDIKSVTLSPGQQVNLNALGLYGDKKLSLENGAVIYSLHGEDGVAALQSGVLTALKTGTTTLKAAYPVAAADLNGRTVNAEISTLVNIQVEDPGYSFTLMQTGKYTVFALTPNETDAKQRSVTVNNVRTDMLYDAKNNVHLCAFEGTVSFTDIKAGLAVEQGQATKNLILGDDDNNGDVGDTDVAGIIATYLAGFVWNTNDPNRAVRIDLNADGVINVLDALLAAKAAGGYTIPASAEDDAAGLAYSAAIETFDANGKAKSSFEVGETVIAKVVLRNTGSKTAPVYAYQGRMAYGSGLTYDTHTAADDSTAERLAGSRELAFASVNAAGTELAYPNTLFTVRFTAAADGKPTFRLSDVIVANSGATERNVMVSESTQIVVGTGVRAPTLEALSDDILAARALLESAIVSDTEISAYAPAFRVTQQVYQQLSQQIGSAEFVLNKVPEPDAKEIQEMLDALQAAVDLFNENKIYRQNSHTGGGSSGGVSQATVSVEISSGEGGMASFGNGNVTKVKKGTSLTIYAVPEEGYEVLSIYINGERFPGQNTYTIASVEHSTEVRVEFCPKLPFTDVLADSWYYDSVRYAWANGLIKGVEENLFAPEVTTTRAMIVTMLHRLEGEPEASGSTFSDVKDADYYAKPVAWAAQNNIVMGYGDGLFGPDDTITREQLAAILYRYAAYKNYKISGSADLSAYSDESSISGYAIEAIRWANANELITGKGNGILDPGGNALRCEVSAILLRFMEQIAK